MTLETYPLDNAPGTVELELLSNDPPDDAGGTILYIRVDPEDEDIVLLCVDVSGSRFTNLHS